MFELFKRLRRKKEYQLKMDELALANSQAALVMVEVLSHLAVKTNYRLTAAEVGGMFRSTAHTLVNSLDEDTSVEDRAAVLAMVSAIEVRAVNVEGKEEENGQSNV